MWDINLIEPFSFWTNLSKKESFFFLFPAKTKALVRYNETLELDIAQLNLYLWIYRQNGARKNLSNNRDLKNANLDTGLEIISLLSSKNIPGCRKRENWQTLEHSNAREREREIFFRRAFYLWFWSSSQAMSLLLSIGKYTERMRKKRITLEEEKGMEGRILDSASETQKNEIRKGYCSISFFLIFLFIDRSFLVLFFEILTYDTNFNEHNTQTKRDESATFLVQRPTL